MAQSARLDFRLDQRTKDLIAEAASLRGQSLSDFATLVLTKAARKVIRQHRVTTLSNRDRDIFLALLDAEAEPNDALRRAAERLQHHDDRTPLE